jgi:hypothetical protein
MNGRLTCHSCRALLAEDKKHEQEQQKYEDKDQEAEERRQARYRAQLEGTSEGNTTMNTTAVTTTEETKQASPDSPMSSSQDERDLPQNFTRITWETLFGTRRLGGKIQQRINQTITHNTNRYQDLPEVQDPPPSPRWTDHLLRYQIANIRRRTQQMSKSSHRLLGDLTRTPEQKLQSRVRRLEAALHSDSLLEVGATPQMPFANAASLLVPNTSSLQHVEGGLTPLTPNLLNLRQNVTFIKPSDKHKTLQLLVTTKTGKLRDKPHPASERVRPYSQPSLQEAITLHSGQHIIVDGQWVLRGQPTISHQPQEPNKNKLAYTETNTRRARGTQLDTPLPIVALPERYVSPYPPNL